MWESVLILGETIQYECGMGTRYRFVYAGPGVAGAVVCLFFILTSGSRYVLFPMVVFIGITALTFWYTGAFIRYALTDRRLLIRRGVFSTTIDSVDYDKISDFSLNRSWEEKVFLGTGSLDVNAVGIGGLSGIGGKTTAVPALRLEHIDHPQAIQRKLEQAMNVTRNVKENQ